MFLADAIFALILAVAFGLLLSSAFGVRGPWAAPWAVFVVLFLLIWAGGIWVTPVGPVVYGVYWLPFLLIGLLAVLLLAGAEPPRRVRSAGTPESEAAAAGLSAFFWVLIALLAVAIFARYL